MLQNGFHISYCSNVHPAESWKETLNGLKQYTLELARKYRQHSETKDIEQTEAAVKPFGIGLRLSARAAAELVGNEIEQSPAFADFISFLRQENLYVYTINGFPYGNFHGQSVKEKVHEPDWRSEKRRIYTEQLIDIMAALLKAVPPPSQPTSHHDALPASVLSAKTREATRTADIPVRIAEGSISTSPLGYKSHLSANDLPQIKTNLLACVDRMKKYRSEGLHIHLNLEPEPDGWLETSDDAIHFFQDLYGEYNRDDIASHLGICFDTCHMAVHYEDINLALSNIEAAGIRIGKIQISSALKILFNDSRETQKTEANCNTGNGAHIENIPFIIEELEKFQSIYLAQVIEKTGGSDHKQGRTRTIEKRQFRDLPEALDDLQKRLQKTNPRHRTNGDQYDLPDQWRIHFHIPIFRRHYGLFASTQEAITITLNYLGKQRQRQSEEENQNDRNSVQAGCRHLEIETYTWSVLPEQRNSGRPYSNRLIDMLWEEFQYLEQNIQNLF